MNRYASTFVTLVIFLTVAVFGAYITLGHGAHEVNCPFMPGEMVVCAISIFEHLGHWQTAFAVAFGQTLLLLALAIVYVRPELLKLPDRALQRVQAHRYRVMRPTLLQELFSRGILHPKAP